MGWLLGILIALGLEIRYLWKADSTELFSRTNINWIVLPSISLGFESLLIGPDALIFFDFNNY